jgi:hypothetical protein
MNTVEFPSALAFSTWERAAAAAKAKPAGLGDGLKSLKKLYDAIDFAVFDIAKLSSVEEAKERGQQIDAAIDRRVKPLEAQAKSVESAADKWIVELKKTKPEPAAAISATDAASRAAATLLRGVGTLASSAKTQLAKRLTELETAEAKAGEKEEPKQAQHRLRLKARVIEGLRIVKNRPDREIFFVVCAGNRECLPYLGPIAGSTQKGLLKTVMKGDTGLKFYYGRCIYEESCYTFVGLALPSALRKRLENNLLALTGSMWRVRVRSGTVKQAKDAKGAKDTKDEK